MLILFLHRPKLLLGSWVLTKACELGYATALLGQESSVSLESPCTSGFHQLSAPRSHSLTFYSYFYVTSYRKAHKSSLNTCTKPVQNNMIYINQNLNHLNFYWQDNGEHKGWLSRPGLFRLSIPKVFSVEPCLGSWEISDLCSTPPSYVKSPIPGSQIMEGEDQFCPLTSTLRQWWTSARACAHRKKGWLQVLSLLLLHPVLRINSVWSLLLLGLII